MEVLQQILQQAKLVFNKMSPSQRVSFLLVLASMIICLFIVFFWSTKPDYVVLYSNLSMKDAAEIQEKLTDLNVPNKVVGTTIKVPSKEVYNARLSLANEGLPRSSEVGFEIFDKIKVGQTDYMQRLNYQRALEGELTRTINSLKQIDHSRIHLVMPEETIFSDKEKPASASIVLTLQPGAVVDKSTVMAITHLVAASVEGLEPKNITVIDSQGNLLSMASDEQMAAGLSSQQIDVQRNVERYLEQKASSLLDGILGPRKSIVRVSVDLDFSQTEKTEESFKPEQQVARSENHVEETAEQQAKSNTVEKTTTNYEIGRTVEHMIGATGSMRWISVAVVVDGTYRVAAEGDQKGQRVYVARTDDELQTLKKLIIGALGLNEKRGDQIEVNNIAFDTTYLDEEATEQQQAHKMALINRIVSQWPWLIVIAIFGVLVHLLRGMLKTAGDMRVSLPKFMMQGTGPVRGVMTTEEAEAEQEEEEERQRVVGKGLKLPPVSKLEQEVSQLAMQNPDTIARIVRSWMQQSEPQQERV